MRNSARPIFTTIESLFGFTQLHNAPAQSRPGLSGFTRGLLKGAVRVFVILIIMALAIVCPSFDRIMALMGSAFCFTICVVLPLAFYLKLFGKEVSMQERILDWFLIIVCSIMAVIGTAWAFIPKDMILGAN